MSANNESMQTQSIKEQLSALMDGELSRDETRFLLRRLDADAQLAATWSSYQIASDVLKKRFATPMRADFAVSVLQAVAAEQPTASHGWLRWAGGGAIAAAVAVFALTTTRPLDDAAPPQQPAIAATSPVAPAPNIQDIDRRMQSGILPGMSALDYTSAASYDQFLDGRSNRAVYPPLIEAPRPPAGYYVLQVESKP